MSSLRNSSYARLGVREARCAVPDEKLLTLLERARAVLERHLFEADGERIRDDIAEVCMAIDDALPQVAPVAVAQAAPRRSAA